MLFKKITSFFQQKSEVPVCEKLRAFDAPRYAVEQYQIDSFVRMTGICEFRGKRILEIGGSNLPVELTRDCLGAKEWVCVDNMPTAFDHAKSAAHYARHTIQKLTPQSRLNFSHYSIFDGKIEDIPASFHNKFDLVVSFCAFEHFTHPEILLDVVKKCLKKDGWLLSYFGPIFSCACGHHCWVNTTLNFNDYTHLPKFCHLLMTPDELEQHLLDFYPLETVRKAIDQIYYSDRVNRFHYEDYVRFFENAGFSECSVSSGYEEPVEEDILCKVASAYPQYSNFTTYSIFVSCKK